MDFVQSSNWWDQKNLSTVQNSKVSAFGSILKYCINGASIGTAPSGHVSEVTSSGRCLLREAVLYLCVCVCVCDLNVPACIHAPCTHHAYSNAYTHVHTHTCTHTHTHTCTHTHTHTRTHTHAHTHTHTHTHTHLTENNHQLSILGLMRHCCKGTVLPRWRWERS